MNIKNIQERTKQYNILWQRPYNTAYVSVILHNCVCGFMDIFLYEIACFVRIISYCAIMLCIFAVGVVFFIKCLLLIGVVVLSI